MASNSREEARGESSSVLRARKYMMQILDRMERSMMMSLVSLIICVNDAFLDSIFLSHSFASCSLCVSRSLVSLNSIHFQHRIREH